MALSSPPRGRSDRHHTGGRANVRHRLQLLLLVLGALALLLAALLALLTLMHDDLTRDSLLRLAIYHGAGGAACLLLRFAVHTLPAWLSQRRSPTYQRRREQSLRRQQSERSSERGSVLILVLILLGLLSALVLQVQLHARGQLRAEQESLRVRDLQRAATDAARAALRRQRGEKVILAWGRAGRHASESSHIGDALASMCASRQTQCTVAHMLPVCLPT